MNNFRYQRVYENLPEGTFPGGARLRGYTGPKVEHPKLCVCHIPTQKNEDIDKNIGTLAGKYGIVAYTLELYFSHCAPLLIRDIASARIPLSEIIANTLITLTDSQLQTIEEIQIEYLDGNTHEFKPTEIEEIRHLFIELKKGGYVSQKNDYMAIPAMNQMF